LKVRTALSAVLVIALSAAGVGACSSGGDKKVRVTLAEWTVTPDATSHDAGTIEFVADNRGTVPHELMIVRARTAAALPETPEGEVEEDDLPDGTVIGRIEDIAPGTSKSIKVKLAPGAYVLLCNVGEEDEEVESHFGAGMHADFAVK
jgi:uncharacterized cupredoxin-like copper-binding protein